MMTISIGSAICIVIASMGLGVQIFCAIQFLLIGRYERNNEKLEGKIKRYKQSFDKIKSEIEDTGAHEQEVN